MVDPTLHDAFTELHGDRLHGFALIVTLGDDARASRLSAEILERGAEHATELRHPERAAAFLRTELTDAAGGPAWGQRRPSTRERRDALARLGIDGAAFDALARLDVHRRAAIAAGLVERFAAADVDAIAGGHEAARRARRDYLEAYVAALAARGTEPAAGPLAAHIRSVAGPVLHARS